MVALSIPAARSLDRPALEWGRDTEGVPDFPGHAVFGQGKSNGWILLLRLRLVIKGWADEQKSFLDHDYDWQATRQWDNQLHAAVVRIQLAQGLPERQADGIPTLELWRQLWT